MEKTTYTGQQPEIWISLRTCITFLMIYLSWYKVYKKQAKNQAANGGIL